MRGSPSQDCTHERSSRKERAKIGAPSALLSLKTSFFPVLWPFCPVLCPFFPSHESLKFAETVYDKEFIGNFEGLSGIKDIKGTFLVLCFSLGARVSHERG